MKVYLEPRDVWVGWYRGETHHYVCPLPCIVIRWPRRTPAGWPDPTPPPPVVPLIGRQCDACGMVSWNPTDLVNDYCANCHGITAGHAVREKTIGAVHCPASSSAGPGEPRD